MFKDTIGPNKEIQMKYGGNEDGHRETCCHSRNGIN